MSLKREPIQKLIDSTLPGLASAAVLSDSFAMHRLIAAEPTICSIGKRKAFLTI